MLPSACLSLVPLLFRRAPVTTVPSQGSPICYSCDVNVSFLLFLKHHQARKEGLDGTSFCMFTLGAPVCFQFVVGKQLITITCHVHTNPYPNESMSTSV